MHDAVRRYISGFQNGQTPCLIVDNQVLYGGTVLTVCPSLESDRIESIRLEVPHGRPTRETLIFFHFFAAVLGGERFIEIMPRLKESMPEGGEFNEAIDEWRIRVFWKAEQSVFLAEALSQAKENGNLLG
jgi:hypothetical protein